MKTRIPLKTDSLTGVQPVNVTDADPLSACARFTFEFEFVCVRKKGEAFAVRPAKNVSLRALSPAPWLFLFLFP